MRRIAHLTTMHAHLLITGFSPFPGVPSNPSAALARRVAALPRLRSGLGAAPRVLILRTTYDALDRQLGPALRERPVAVLMIGVASRARRVRVESRARNRASGLFPDASGRVAGRLILETDGPAERRGVLAVHALACLRRNGIAAVSSQDAGRYLCNAAYYRALREDVPVLFLHIPRFARPDRPKAPGRRKRQASIDPLARAVAVVADLLRQRARAGL
jgi:pyroglutamyl-peptidase